VFLALVRQDGFLPETEGINQIVLLAPELLTVQGMLGITISIAGMVLA
jgi:hypothetical protein